MSNISAIVAGVIFVALAAGNVVIMLEASQLSRSPEARTRLIAAHRAGGYLFVTLFCTMVYGMTQRLAGVGITGHLPTYLVLHIVLVLFLIPLLLLKILVVRRYRQNQPALKALGIAIFVIAFVVVAIPTLSELLRSANPGSAWSRLVSGLIISACLAQFGLVFKKSKSARLRPERLPEPQTPTQSIPSTDGKNQDGPMNLLLANIERETHDTTTLRFLLPKERRFRARPGQFLTFNWIIDGRRVVRSYTVSSSPSRRDYVEITPKRMENGCASVFLNEHAKPGLSVEAIGPYGHFCFDEKLHKNIVLIAAGSGITPMISILRYIDDLKLSTRVSLLYCVRTAADIIFRSELARLERALPDFRYNLCLSRPHREWAGASGHLNAELVSQHIIDVTSSTFFLCGPKGFMENAQSILLSLGASEDILRESFGEAPGESRPLDTTQSETVVFINSQKTCQASIGCTLLDVAERNGVQIPYSCRQGQCGTCATRVLSGAVQMDVEEGLTVAQKDAGYILPCVSHAKGTVVLAV